MSKIPELLVAAGKFKQDITRIYELADALEAAEPELRALLAERDALREALTACVAYMKDDSGGYETYKATLEHAESILNATLNEGERHE